MKILSINVSMGREVEYGDGLVKTSIFKAPVDGRVVLRHLNLDGDAQSDLNAHGGIYRAAYVYSIENYEFWKQELKRDDFAFAQFGENLTVDEMLEDDVHVGDVFRVGNATVEVTQPRVPCFKLGIKMGMPQFVRMFLRSCRVGFYLRVLQEGEIGAGDTIELLRPDPERMSVREMTHLLYFDRDNIEDARRALRIRAMSPGWRGSFKERLEEAGLPVEHA
ncbi:MAG TPA: MOSC domain-containing protein [Blastocatellia bacterium]|nr:MOSC domain-containing protein [Blastocatellia bacterium]